MQAASRAQEFARQGITFEQQRKFGEALQAYTACAEILISEEVRKLPDEDGQKLRKLCVTVLDRIKILQSNDHESQTYKVAVLPAAWAAEAAGIARRRQSQASDDEGPNASQPSRTPAPTCTSSSESSAAHHPPSTSSTLPSTLQPPPTHASTSSPSHSPLSRPSPSPPLPQAASPPPSSASSAPHPYVSASLAPSPQQGGGMHAGGAPSPNLLGGGGGGGGGPGHTAPASHSPRQPAASPIGPGQGGPGQSPGQGGPGQGRPGQGGPGYSHASMSYSHASMSHPQSTQPPPYAFQPQPPFGPGGAAVPPFPFQNDGGAATSTHANQPKESATELLARLFLGDDSSGGGHSRSPAASLGNALAALLVQTVGDLVMLAPIPDAQWEKYTEDLKVLLSPLAHVKEKVKSEQVLPDGSCHTVYTEVPRRDIQEHIPVLQQVLTTLRDLLSFYDPAIREFSYETVDRSHTRDGQWWHPRPLLPPGGLSAVGLGALVQHQKTCRECIKICRTARLFALSQMSIPEEYIRTAEKKAAEILSSREYDDILDHEFNADSFVRVYGGGTSAEREKLLNRIEMVTVAWSDKKKTSKKRGLSREECVQRCQRIERALRESVLTQSTLDGAKVLHNKDIALAAIEAVARSTGCFGQSILRCLNDLETAN